ncbi:response regulator [Variovorax sp. OV329]|uniref:response regulator n=1 Tax=Variovorax sp. OV329 TaxID=1882825 RepID=UPI0008ECB5E6|nr:response regulator [Variovorax sp. OV329]SFN25670.1 Response regulator receiver domain-containing protein [Variovorax sp. OV329]
MSLVTILVEDNQAIRENLLAAMDELTDLDVVATAETAAQAACALDAYSQSWDLAVVDLFLKQGSGLTVLKACQERPPDRHVLVLTNYPTPDIRRRCMDLGADAVFDKSTELEAFFDRCNDYARETSRRRQTQPARAPVMTPRAF